jgi:energy-coupling factor transporter ATP-binding protein EcfA2
MHQAWSPPPPEETGRAQLPPGSYNPEMLRTLMGAMVAFEPIVEDNDQAVEVNKAVTDTLAELSLFLNRGETYAKFQVAHKRGYLFHGPPGCGKSTALRLLSERFVQQTGGVVLRVSDLAVSIEPWLSDIRTHEGNRPVLAIAEDIDHDLGSFETVLLEFLDGAKQLNNFVFVATTNSLDAIPERIKFRPSRIDRIIEITPPSTAARCKYLERFPLDPKTRAAIAEVTAGITMADLKEVVIATQILGEELEPAVARVRRGVGAAKAAAPKGSGGMRLAGGLEKLLSYPGDLSSYAMEASSDE